MRVMRPTTGTGRTQTASRFGESVVLAHVTALLTVRKSPAPLDTVATSDKTPRNVNPQAWLGRGQALYLSVSVSLCGVISPRYPPDQGKMDCNMQWKDISKTLRSTTKGTQQKYKQKHKTLTSNIKKQTNNT